MAPSSPATCWDWMAKCQRCREEGRGWGGGTQEERVNLLEVDGNGNEGGDEEYKGREKKLEFILFFFPLKSSSG